MEYFYVSVIFISSILEEILFYHIMFQKRASVSWKNIALLLVSYALLVVMTYMEVGVLYMSAVIVCTDFYVGCRFFQLSAIQNMKYWIVSILLIMLLEQVLIGMFIELFSFTWVSSVYGVESMLACLLVLAAAFFVDAALRYRRRGRMPFLTKIHFILIPVIAGVVICLSYMVYLVSGLQEEAQRKFGFLLFVVIVIAICVAVLAVFHLYQKKEYFMMQSILEGRYAEQQKEYFLLLLEKEEDTKRFRHDLVEHLLCIYNALENQDYPAVDTYITDVLSGLDTISHKQYDMGNEVCNVILNYYLVPLRNTCDILVEGYVGKLETVSRMDLCIIFSNAIKNAIEGAGKNGRIRVCGNRGRDFIRLVVGNTYSGNIRKGKKGRLETTKPDRNNHGFGVENMQGAVQKNHGKCNFHIKDNWFEVEMILPVHDRN